MVDWKQPTTLSSLSTKDAIVDAVYRMVTGLDTSDFELYKSAIRWDDKSYLEIKGRRTFQGAEGLEKLFRRFVDFTTTHMLTNIRVNQTSEDEAIVYAYTLNNHLKKSDPSTYFLAGLICKVDLVKEGDLWKVVSFISDIQWTTGDPSVCSD